MKHRLATALLVIGLLLSGVSAVVAYLARTVLNEAAFSAHFVSALQRPGLSAYVSQRIADGVVLANRDLTGVKPVISTFAQALVNSAAFQVLAGRGAREAHRVVFSEGAEHVMLSVPDVGVLLRGALQTVNPEVAQKVPANVRAIIDTRLTGKIAGRVLSTLRLAGRIRFLARVGVVIGLLLIITGVALSPHRRQALLNASIGLLGVAAVLALVVPLGRAMLMGTIPDPALRAAVGDLWSAYAGGLRTWAIGVATVALMILAGAAAFLEQVTLRNIIRRALTELGGRQPSPGREAVRVLVLMVVGGFAIGAPLATLATIMVLLGALVMARGVYELVALVAPHPPVTDTAEAVSLRLNPALAVAVSCVVLAAAGLGALALAFRFQPQVAQAATGPVLECNGAEALCDRRVDEITFAGAHNAMGAASNPHWMFPNQDAALPQMLRRGVRAFMLDVVSGLPVADRIKTDFATEDQRNKYEKAIGPEAFAAAMRVRDRLVGESGAAGLYMCHGFCELGAVPFDTALAQLKDFLVENPSDVVMLIIEDYVPPEAIAAAFDRQELTSYLYSGPARGPFPTLRELIGTNQRLIIFGEHQTGGLPWYLPAFEAMQETPYTFHVPEDFSCKPNRGDPTNPLLLINHWIETTPAPRPSNAKLVNAESVLVQRARDCERERKRRPNIIAVDFAATGDVVRAAAILNGLAQPTPADSAQ